MNEPYRQIAEPELCILCEQEDTVHLIYEEPICRKCMSPEEWDKIQGFDD